MAADALEIRMARLEGAYQQLDRRLEDLRTEVVALRAELHEGLGALRTELHAGLAAVRAELHGALGGLRTETRGEIAELRQDIRRVNGRLDWLVAGVFLAILAPVLVRLFFP